MHDQLEAHARYLAYRWRRLTEPGITHREGWEFANTNWANFLFEAKKRFNLEEDELALLGDGSDSVWDMPLAGAFAVS